MNISSTVTPPRSSTLQVRSSALRVATGVLIAAVVAVAVNGVVSIAAHALGASDDFQQLKAPAFGSLTVLGVLFGTGGWAMIRRWTRRPATVLRLLVPAVLVVSLVPDLLLLSDSTPGSSGLAVGALMVMHLAVTVVLVTVLRRVLPITDRA